MRKCLYLLVLLLALPGAAAPVLSESDRENLADGTTDRDDVLDTQPGLYVLLRNAATWKGDDFGGDAGAAVAPPPDYGFLKDKPEQARGNVYLIEGWFVGSDRWPTLVNHSSDKLHNTMDPSWGDQVTRWMIVTEKGNADATVMVMFNDPNAKMIAPEQGSKVRIAARFHKLWTIPDSDGKPFNYPLFVGGAAEITEAAGTTATSSGGGTSSFTKILAAIVIVAGFFIAMRILMKKVSTGGGGGTMLRDRLEEMRREREALEQRGEDDEEDAEDLPEDPIAALDALRQKHEVND